jgi:hypothetical protein
VAIERRRKGEESLEALVMAEVNKQIEPVKKLLTELHEWQLAFWANGSGRVPGFFQRRIQDDDRWRATVDDHKTKVDTLIYDLCKAREFREKREEEEKVQRQKRHDFWISIFWKVGLPIALGICSIVGTGIVKATPIIKILWEDYLRAHPAVTQQMKNITTVSPDVAHNKAIQQATE